MLRFFGFLILLVSIAAGILWIVDPTYLGGAPRVPPTIKETPKPERYTVKDDLEVKAKEGNNAIRSNPANTTLRDPVEMQAVLRPSIDQEISAQFERRIQEISVQPGQTVRTGQVIAQLDDSVSKNEVQARKDDYELKTKFQIEAAAAEYLTTKQIYERDDELYKKNAISKQEWEISKFRMLKAEYEWRKAEVDREIAKSAYDKAVRELEMHKLTSEVTGTVQKVHKKKGETARVGEPIVTINSTDRLWVEGAVEQQYVQFLYPGMRVQIFPERTNPPMRELREHKDTITGLAISPDSRLVASSSKDGRVLLWNWRQTNIPIWQGKTLRPDVDFESVVFSPVVHTGTDGETTYQILAGCSDGTALVWTINIKPGRFGSLEAKVDNQLELKHDYGHTGAVTAAAITPNGQFAALGGEDRQISIWNISKGEFRYTVRADTNENETAHRGTVTSLHFMPEGLLISAAADRTLKKWKLGEKVAELKDEIGGRSGDVKQIAISGDGKLALFDHEEELRVLNLDNFTTMSVLTAKQLGHFKNLACFSPDGDMILTTTANGRLQLWSTPERPEYQTVYRMAFRRGIRKNNFHILGLLAARINTTPEFCTQSVAWAMTATPQDARIGNGSSANLFLGIPELWNFGGQPFRQLQTPEATTETCGVFALTEPVFFTGGTDKVIRVWAKPTTEEVNEALEAVVTFVGNQVEGGLVRVRAEMNNPDDPGFRLPVGTKVNLRAFPETLPAERSRK